MNPRILSRVIATTAIAVLAGLLAAPGVRATPLPTPGQVDMEFADGRGVIMDPIRGGDTFTDMLVDEESRTLVVGYTWVGGQQFPILGRIVPPVVNPNYTDYVDFYDLDFGSNSAGGRILVDLSGQVDLHLGGSRLTAQLQYDGLLPAEADAGFTTVEQWRLSAPDQQGESQTIIAGGWVMALRPSDSATIQVPLLMRFLDDGNESDGEEDGRFGSDGKLVLRDLGLQGRSWVSAVFPLADASLLVGITEEIANDSSPQRRTHVLRVDESGTASSLVSVGSSDWPTESLPTPYETAGVTLSDHAYSDLHTIVKWEYETSTMSGGTLETQTVALVRTVGGPDTRSISIDTLVISDNTPTDKGIDRVHHEILSAPSNSWSAVTSWTAPVHYEVPLNETDFVSARSFYLGGAVKAGVNAPQRGFVVRISESESGFPALDDGRPSANPGAWRFGVEGWYLDPEAGTSVTSLAPMGGHIVVALKGVAHETSFAVTRFLLPYGSDETYDEDGPNLPFFDHGRVESMSVTATIPLMATSPDGDLTAVLMAGGNPQMPLLHMFTSGLVGVSAYTTDTWPLTLSWGLPSGVLGAPIPFTGWVGAYDSPFPAHVQGSLTNVANYGSGSAARVVTAGVTNAGTYRDFLVVSRVDADGLPDENFSMDGSMWLDLEIGGEIPSLTVRHLAVHEPSGTIAVTLLPTTLLSDDPEFMVTLLISSNGTEVTRWATGLREYDGDNPLPILYSPIGLVVQSETSVITAMTRSGIPYPQPSVGLLRLEVREVAVDDEEWEELAHDEAFGVSEAEDPIAETSTRWSEAVKLVWSQNPSNLAFTDSRGHIGVVHGDALLMFHPHTGDVTPPVMLSAIDETWTVQALVVDGDSVTAFGRPIRDTDLPGIWAPQMESGTVLRFTTTSPADLHAVPLDMTMAGVLVTGIATDNGGNLVLSGVETWIGDVSALGVPWITRFTPDGQLDQSFGVRGQVMPFPPFDDDPESNPTGDLPVSLSFAGEDLIRDPFFNVYSDVPLPWWGFTNGITVIGERAVIMYARVVGLTLHPTLVAIDISVPETDSGDADSGGDGPPPSSQDEPQRPAVTPLLPTVTPGLTRTDTTLTCTVGEFSQTITEASVRLVIDGVREPAQTLAAGVRSATWPAKPEWAGASITCEVFVRAGSATSTTQSESVVIPKPITPTPTPTPTPTVDPTTPSTSGFSAVRRSVNFTGTTTRMTSTQVRGVRSWAQGNSGATEVICRAAAPTKAGVAQARARAQAVCASVARVHRNADVKIRVKVTRNQPERTVVATLRIPRS